MVKFKGQISEPKSKDRGLEKKSWSGKMTVVDFTGKITSGKESKNILLFILTLYLGIGKEFSVEEHLWLTTWPQSIRIRVIQ